MVLDKTQGKRLQAARKRAAKTLVIVGSEVGVSSKLVQRWETGVPVTEKRKEAYAKSLGVDPKIFGPAKAFHTRVAYPLEFKLKALSLYRAKRNGTLTAAELKVPMQTLQNWINAERRGALLGKIAFNVVEADCLLNLISEKLGALELPGTVKTNEHKVEIKVLKKLRAKLIAK